MKTKNRQRLYNLIISVGALLTMWLVWLIACYVVDDAYVVPPISDTVSEFFSLLASAKFWKSFGMTLLRTLYSWALSLAVAVSLASISAAFKGVRRYLAPFIAVFRTVPTMAITLMLLIWSTPRVAPTIVAMLMVFPIAYSQMLAAFDGIDGRLLEMARAFNLPLNKRLFKILIPQTLPPMLSQIGANLSLTLKVIISAEVLCSTFNSLGGLIYQSNVFLNTAQMFALTICALVAGGLLEWIFGKFTLITHKWTGDVPSRSRKVGRQSEDSAND